MAVAAAVVLLLVLLAAVTAHVLTTPVHRPAVAPAILSRPPTVLLPTAVPAIGWLSVGTVVVLLILLVEKQRVVGIPGGRARKLNLALTIAILPLLGALAVNVLVEAAASVSQDSQSAVPAPTAVPARDGAPLAAPQATKPVATPTHIPRRIVPTAPQQQPRAPTVLVNPPELRFGHQRLHVASAAQTVYVVNLEPTALRITGVAIAGGHAVSAFAASTVCAGAPIPAYDRCAISVRFRPSTSGTYSASLIIASTAAGSPQRVALSGVGSMVAPGPVARPLSRRLSPSIPSIRRFTLVHPHQGQPYELVWQARDATSLTLNGRPVSAHGIVVLHAPLHSVTYQLVARNGSRRATADLPVVVDARSTNPHAVVLATPDIATFAVRRRQGKLYVTWLVRHAVHVQLQGQSVASAGARPVPPGTSWLRLVASNDVGSRQGLLHLARPVPLARARTRPAPAPTAHPSRMLAARPTAMPTARRTRTPTPYPMAMFTPQPTSRPTTKLGATGGQAR